MLNTLQFDISRSYCSSSTLKFFDNEPPFFSFDSKVDEMNSSSGDQSSAYYSKFLNPDFGLSLFEEEEENKSEFNQSKHQLFSFDKQSFFDNALNIKEKKAIFKVDYPIKEKDSLFANIENDSSSYEFLNEKEEKMFTKRKRFAIRRPRRENQDNIRKKIKRGFFNHALIGKLNEILTEIGSKLLFEKFPQAFVCDVNKKTNKEIMNMTLEEIFEKKDLFKKEQEKYKHNLRVVKSADVKENEEFRKILKKKYCQLFEEYVKSKEFKIDEVNRLKKYNMKDYYIKKYIYLSRHFMEYFSQ